MSSSLLPPAPDVAEADPVRGAAAPVRRARRLRRTVPAWFLLPAAAFYLFSVIVPSVQGTAFAFTSWDGLSPTTAFVGLDQFRRLLGDADARGAIVNTLVIGLGITVVQTLVGLLLALGVHSKIKSRHVLRVLFFAPAVITSVATGYLWRNLLGVAGAVNSVLDAVGLGSLAQNWLGDADLALYAVVAVIVWQFAGYSMVIFLAGLQGVPEEVIEASHLDGAGPVRRFWSITRPFLAPAFTITMMLSLIGGLKLFDQVWVMTGGGPGGATETISTLIYKNAFQFGAFGYSTAMALVLTGFVAVMSLVQYRVLARQGA